jgi:hypothetical protein
MRRFLSGNASIARKNIHYGSDRACGTTETGVHLLPGPGESFVQRSDQQSVMGAALRMVPLTSMS